MDYETFRKEKRETAIDALFNSDYRLLSDYVNEAANGDDIDAEYAKDILDMGLTVLLARRDKTLTKEQVKKLDDFFEHVVVSAPFFEELVDFKLQQLWDSGDMIWE